MSLRHRALVVSLFVLVLAACTAGSDAPGMSFETTLSTETGTVDAGEAASLISAYRKSQGRGPVTVDPVLMQIARVHSDRMAASGTMSHVLPGEGSFHDRLVAGNYDAGMAAENVAAGQSSLAEVLAAWKKSPSHNDNLLEEHVTEIGIAVSIAKDSRYKYFWTLVLGQRKPAGAGPSGGTTVTVGGPTVTQ